MQVSEGPELNGWKPKIENFSTKSLNKIRALGDLHGWAPGLITYLTNHQLAKIDINGLPMYIQSAKKDKSLQIHTENMKKLFPIPLEYFEQNGKFLMSGLRDFQIPDTETPKGGFFSIKAEWIAPDDTGFIQLGDIFDRGDYSELSAEILRQLVIQAPFRVFVLLGDHEQILLENDFDTWFQTENAYSYSEEPTDKAFHTRFHMETYKWTSRDEETIKREVFYRYKVSCALLFLTQFCAQAKLQPKLKRLIGFPGLDDEIVLNGGWKAYKHAKQVVMSTVNLKYFPGAITLLGLGHTIFSHGSPAAFGEINVKDFKDSLLRVQLNSIDCIFATYHIVSGDIKRSMDYPLLWSQKGASGAKDVPPKPEATKFMANLLDIFPGTRHFVQGHRPTYFEFKELKGNYPLSYLARNFGEYLSRNIGNVRVHMLDEGISPLYFKGPTDFDPTRIPIGLYVHKDLANFQGISTENLEEKQEDWFKIIDTKEHLIFTIPSVLTLNDVTDIGIFKPGFSIWTRAQPDMNLPDNRFTFEKDSPFSDFKIYRDSSHEKNPARGIAFMLYDKENEILRLPVKIYLKSEQISLPLDKILFQYLNERLMKWMSDGFKGHPLEFEPKEEIEKWLENSLNVEKNLAPFYHTIQRYGLSSLINLSNIIFTLFSLDKTGRPLVILINGTNNELFFKTLIPFENTDISLVAEMKPLSWQILFSHNELSKPILFNWAISTENFQLPSITEQDAFDRSKAGVLEDFTTGTRSLGGLIWISQQLEVVPSKIYHGNLEIIEIIKEPIQKPTVKESKQELEVPTEVISKTSPIGMEKETIKPLIKPEMKPSPRPEGTPKIEIQPPSRAPTSPPAQRASIPTHSPRTPAPPPPPRTTVPSPTSRPATPAPPSSRPVTTPSRRAQQVITPEIPAPATRPPPIKIHPVWQDSKLQVADINKLSKKDRKKLYFNAELDLFNKRKKEGFDISVTSQPFYKGPIKLAKFDQWVKTPFFFEFESYLLAKFDLKEEWDLSKPPLDFITRESKAPKKNQVTWNFEYIEDEFVFRPPKSYLQVEGYKAKSWELYLVSIQVYLKL